MTISGILVESGRLVKSHSILPFFCDRPAMSHGCDYNPWRKPNEFAGHVVSFHFPLKQCNHFSLDSVTVIQTTYEIMVSQSGSN